MNENNSIEPITNDNQIVDESVRGRGYSYCTNRGYHRLGHIIWINRDIFEFMRVCRMCQFVIVQQIDINSDDKSFKTKTTRYRHLT